MRAKGLEKCVVVVALVLSGCVTTPTKRYTVPTDYVPISRVQITDQFSTITLTLANLETEIKKCLGQQDSPSATINGVKAAFPSRVGNSLMHVGSSKRFLITGATGACMETSSEKFPIFPAKAFERTVNPSGVAPDITTQWYREIAMRIAVKGSTKVAYVFNTGNAVIANYWVNSNEMAINYSSELKMAGTWEPIPVDAKYSHPTMTATTTTKRNSLSVKAFPLDE